MPIFWRPQFRIGHDDIDAGQEVGRLWADPQLHPQPIHLAGAGRGLQVAGDHPRPLPDQPARRHHPLARQADDENGSSGKGEFGGGLH